MKFPVLPWPPWLCGEAYGRLKLVCASVVRGFAVGAGTAGCVLARRLLDEKNYGREAVSPAVLLVEAGEGEAPWYASVPLASLALQGTSIDWQYFTEPHEDALHCYMNKVM